MGVERMTCAGLTQEQFLADVAGHRIRVLRDEDGYRHLRFMDPCTANKWFEIVTWPQVLVMSGDMGSWVFRREQDMFGFFRGKQINPDYWAEKVQAADRDGIREFDADEFRADVLMRLDNWDLDGEALAKAHDELSEHLTHYENEWELRQAVADWEFDGEAFDPADMPSGMVYTRRFLWACHAIRWAVEQYDKWKVAP